jgi:hypothetical protein
MLSLRLREPACTLVWLSLRTSGERPRRGQADFRSARAMQKRPPNQSGRSEVARSESLRPRGQDARIRPRAEAAPIGRLTLRR